MTSSHNDQSRQDKKVDRKERLNEPTQLADRYMIC